MRRLFILIPSLVPTGPIKGAIALSNSLAGRFEITIVALKQSAGFPDHIDSRISVVCLGPIVGWRARLSEYRKMLEDAGGRSQSISVSFCFSADIFNFLVRRHSITVSSIRGHLPRTYRVDYGFAGTLLAKFHYQLASQLDCVVAMTDHMASQFSAMTGKRPVVIGNFIDEARLETFRSTRSEDSATWHFIFVGRLDPLKSPELVIEAVLSLAEQGINCLLDVFGDGPLRQSLRSMVHERARGDMVRFHGHVENPWKQAAGAHCLVLPSLTEGISRAALEALYLGIPCVMRDVDSNIDLIQSGENGELFQDDASLVTAMKKCALLGRHMAEARPVLLGESFRQSACVGSYGDLLEKCSGENGGKKRS